MSKIQVVDFTQYALGCIRLERDDVDVAYVMKLDEYISRNFVTDCKFRNDVWRIHVRAPKTLKTVLTEGGYTKGMCLYDGE